MNVRNLPYVFLSATIFGSKILENLLSKGCIPKAIFTIPQYFSISYSSNKVKNYNFYDFAPIARKYKIPLYSVESAVSPISSYQKVLASMHLDFMLVAGWYYKIPENIYMLSRLGAFGFHNSLLPKYAGGAPLVWAMICGEKEAGVTLFKMNNHMDSGAIILQESFEIAQEDTIKEVLDKATQQAKAMSLKLFDRDFVITFKEQNAKLEYYPQRNPSDGKIDLNWDSVRMYNFIRAQSAPYPGAFIQTSDGHKLVIDRAHIEWNASHIAPPPNYRAA